MKERTWKDEGSCTEYTYDTPTRMVVAHVGFKAAPGSETPITAPLTHLQMLSQRGCVGGCGVKACHCVRKRGGSVSVCTRVCVCVWVSLVWVGVGGGGGCAHEREDVER